MADDSWIDEVFGTPQGGTATAPPASPAPPAAQGDDSWLDSVFGEQAKQQPVIPPLQQTTNPASVALPPGMTPYPTPAFDPNAGPQFPELQWGVPGNHQPWENPPPVPAPQPKKKLTDEEKKQQDRQQYWDTINFETYGQGDPSERFARAMKYAQEEREQIDKEYWDKPWYRKGAESMARRSIPFVSTALDAANLDATLKAANALQSGQFTNGDIHTVARFLVDAEAAKKAGKAERIGQMIAAMPAFMGELFMTGGLFSEGKVVGEAAVKRAFTKVAEKAAEKGINIAARKSLVRKGAEFVAEKVVGPLAGTAALAAANPQLTARSTIEQMLPTVDVFHDKDGNKVPIELGDGRSFFSALPRAYLDTMIEVGSEYAGGKLTEGAAAVLKRFPGIKALRASSLADRARYLRTEIVKKWLGRSGTRTLRDFNKALGEIGWNGIIGEALEERAGDVARMVPLPGGALQTPYENTTGKLLIAAPYETLTNEDPNVGPKIQQEALGDLAVEGGSFAAPALAFGAGSAVANRLDERVQAARQARNVAAYEQAVQSYLKSNTYTPQQLAEHAQMRSEELGKIAGQRPLNEQEQEEVDFLAKYGSNPQAVADAYGAWMEGGTPPPTLEQIRQQQSGQQQAAPQQPGQPPAQQQPSGQPTPTPQPTQQQASRPQLDVDNAEEWANNNPELAQELIDSYGEGETPSRRQLGGKRFKVQGTGGSTTEQRQDFLERVRAQVQRNRVNKAYEDVFVTPNAGVPEFSGKLTDQWQVLPPGTPAPTGQGIETREQNGQTLIRIAPTARPATADITPQGPVSSWSNDNLKNFADQVGIPRKGLNNATLRNRVQSWLDQNQPAQQAPQAPTTTTTTTASTEQVGSQESTEADQPYAEAPLHDTTKEVDGISRPLTVTGALAKKHIEGPNFNQKGAVRLYFKENDVTEDEVNSLLRPFGTTAKRLNDTPHADDLNQGSRFSIIVGNRTADGVRPLSDAIIEHFGGTRVSTEPGATTLSPKQRKGVIPSVEDVQQTQGTGPQAETGQQGEGQGQGQVTPEAQAGGTPAAESPPARNFPLPEESRIELWGKYREFHREQGGWKQSYPQLPHITAGNETSASLRSFAFGNELRAVPVLQRKMHDETTNRTFWADENSLYHISETPTESDSELGRLKSDKIPLEVFDREAEKLLNSSLGSQQIKGRELKAWLDKPANREWYKREILGEGSKKANPQKPANQQPGPTTPAATTEKQDKPEDQTPPPLPPTPPPLPSPQQTTQQKIDGKLDHLRALHKDPSIRTTKASNEAERSAERQANKRGRQVVWITSDKPQTLSRGATYAESLPDVIFLKSGMGEDSMWGVWAHELAHATGFDRSLFPKKLIDDYANRRLDMSKHLPEYAAKMRANPELWWREGVAQFVEEFMSDPAKREQILRDEPTLYQKIVEFFRKLLGQLGPELTEHEQRVVDWLRGTEPEGKPDQTPPPSGLPDRPEDMSTEDLAAELLKRAREKNKPVEKTRRPKKRKAQKSAGPFRDADFSAIPENTIVRAKALHSNGDLIDTDLDAREALESYRDDLRKLKQLLECLKT